MMGVGGKGGPAKAGRFGGSGRVGGGPGQAASFFGGEATKRIF